MRVVMVLAVLVLISSSLLFAQVNSSTVTGTVTDASGARVPKATVVVTNQATGVSVSTITTGTGEYTTPYLIAGTYKVQVSAAGFATQVAQNAAVGNNATVHVDVILQTGTAEMTVEVNASAAALRTDDVSVKSSIEAAQIDALPNISMNPLLYATTQPGVVAEKTAHFTQSSASMGIGPLARRYLSLISINGGIGFTTDIQLDGIPILASDFNEAGVIPNPDSIQEVQVQTNTFSAAYGHGTGIVEYFSKSGTNQWHGNGVFRIRNEFFNANGFANNFNHWVALQSDPKSLTSDRSKFRMNNFGGSAGGPVLKDKLFFFGSYEGYSRVSPVDKFLTVPTLLERQGDFSQTMIADNSGKPVNVQLYNPFSVTPVAGAVNTYQRALVPNAQITGSLLDPIGLLAFSNYPQPNSPATDAYGTNNFHIHSAQTFKRNAGEGRLDFKLNSHHSIYATGGVAEGTNSTPNAFGANNPFQPPITNPGQYTSDFNPYGAVGDTIIVNPTLVVDVRYGVNRMNSGEGYPSKSTKFDNTPYQIPSQIQALVNDQTLPFDFCPGSKYTCLQNTVGLHINEHQTNHSVVGSATKTLGSFTFKAGAEYRVGLMNSLDPSNANFEIGKLYSDQNYTAQYIDATGNISALNTTNVQLGLQGAQWLMGAGYLSAASSVASALVAKYGAFYEQTTWNATPNLTFNFGLRFELQPAPTERYNRQSAFDTQGSNPFGPGAYVFTGTNGYGRGLYQNHFNDWGPRFGVAYKLDPTTVIRSGFGISYLPTNTGYGFTSQNNTAFTTHNVQNYSAVFGANPNGVPIGTFHSSQVAVIVPALGTNISNPLQYGGSNSYLQDYRGTYDGRLLQWNVFFEKSFTPKDTFSLGYSASRGDRMPFSNVPINGGGANSTGTTPAGFQTISPALLSAWRQQYIASNGATNPAYTPVTNPYSGMGFQGGALSSATTPQWRLQVPYPEFPDLNLLRQTAHSNYQSMVVDFKHTLSHGIQIDVNYVFSKEIDDVQNIGQSNDAYNNAGEQNTGYLLNLSQNTYENRHVGYNDVPNRIVVTGLFESPFGRRKEFLASSRIADWVLGGWRLGTSFSYQTGTPIEITSSMGSLNNRPNRIPGVNPILPQSVRHYYYNPSGGAGTVINLPGGGGSAAGTATITCTGCMPYLNPLAFGGPTVATPNGSTKTDVYWYGNARTAYDDIRSPNDAFFDAQLQRDFRITERVHLDLAVNAFNVFNVTQFQPIQAIGVGSINTSSSSRPFGASSNTTQGLNFFDPRQLQLQGRVTF
ncbi:MAG TPA: TonB-dependent receptor [Acidobacteriaceae bacterium]